MPNHRSGSAAAASLTKDNGGEAALIELGSGRYRLQGALDLSAIAALARQSTPLAQRKRRGSDSSPARQIEIDLGGVERPNSAVIALLLDWVDKAARQQTELVFTNWPQALVRIAAFSNVDGLLGIDHLEPETGEQKPTNGPSAWTSS